MSRCMTCGKEMSDSEARIYEDCLDCRRASRYRRVRRMYPTQKQVEESRKTIEDVLEEEIEQVAKELRVPSGDEQDLRDLNWEPKEAKLKEPWLEPDERS